MTAATFANITCPACGQTSKVSVEALLISVAGGDPDIGIAAPEADAARADSTAATVAWVCDACADLSSIPVDWLTLLTLVTGGATLLDDATDVELPPHPESPAAGAPLTRDDLLALHELLESDTWFLQVSAYQA
jgi:hypothetical protein